MPYNSNFTLLDDGNSTNYIKAYKLYFLGNEWRIYKSDYIFEINLQDYVDHGSLVSMSIADSMFNAVNTSIIHTSASPYAVVNWRSNDLGVCPAVYSGTVDPLAGFNEGWYGNQVLGGLLLSTSPGYVEGMIWYNSTTKELNFYNGTAVRAVTNT